MQTRFTEDQLRDPGLREADGIFRSCVHCGFCQATCPTYVLLGDELDSPRGRIYLMKQMLETGQPPTAEVVTHIDRCLSCLACVSTCPSSVDYMHLVDLARARIEETYRRPLRERLVRRLFATILPRPGLFRLALRAAQAARFLKPYLPGPLATAFELMPAGGPRKRVLSAVGVFPAHGERRFRVALLQGCVQDALAPEITAATVRFFTRHGSEVVVSPQTFCCGALVHHLGRHDLARRWAARNIRSWIGEKRRGGLDAVIATASGCGTMLKDYGHLFKESARWHEPAAEIASLARDISEVAGLLDLKLREVTPLRVAYHSACSLRNGQKIEALPKTLLSRAGFHVSDIPEGHLCCGSAGTYNLLEPEIARRLGVRKAANIGRTGAEVVAAGNIGCMVQIGAYARVPVVHPVELLDWATGGPAPAALGNAAS